MLRPSGSSVATHGNFTKRLDQADQRSTGSACLRTGCNQLQLRSAHHKQDSALYICSVVACKGFGCRSSVVTIDSWLGEHFRRQTAAGNAAAYLAPLQLAVRPARDDQAMRRRARLDCAARRIFWASNSEIQVQFLFVLNRVGRPGLLSVRSDIDKAFLLSFRCLALLERPDGLSSRCGDKLHSGETCCQDAGVGPSE